MLKSIPLGANVPFLEHTEFFNSYVDGEPLPSGSYPSQFPPVSEEVSYGVNVGGCVYFPPSFSGLHPRDQLFEYMMIPTAVVPVTTYWIIQPVTLYFVPVYHYYWEDQTYCPPIDDRFPQGEELTHQFSYAEDKYTECDSPCDVESSEDSVACGVDDVNDGENETEVVSVVLEEPEEDHSPIEEPVEKKTSHDFANLLISKERKRQYRVGLNIFNKKPEQGLKYLIGNSFLGSSPQNVARFLIKTDGLSKEKIAEYFSHIENAFNMEVFEYFVKEVSLRYLEIDDALRKLQSYFKLPDDAQKMDRLIQVFIKHYIDSNPKIACKFNNPNSTLSILACGIFILNTNLHTPPLKPDRRMTLKQFINNLSGINGGQDIDRSMLSDIYRRIKRNRLEVEADHTSLVLRIQKSLSGHSDLNLAVPHRRLVCISPLFQIFDIRERKGHERWIFLFNDLLLVTKQVHPCRCNAGLYEFKQSLPLFGMKVAMFECKKHKYGIQLNSTVENVVLKFSAKTEEQRFEFVQVLEESIKENIVNVQNAVMLQPCKDNLYRSVLRKNHFKTMLVDVLPTIEEAVTEQIEPQPKEQATNEKIDEAVAEQIELEPTDQATSDEVEPVVKKKKKKNPFTWLRRRFTKFFTMKSKVQ